MDTARSLEAEADAEPASPSPGHTSADYPPVREPRMDPPPAIGSDERRMHVRAYNFWVSLLGGRPFPAVDSFDPAHARDFADHGVFLDFSESPEDPAIRFLGAALRDEGGLAGEIRRISQVPGRSLLSRLTSHYLQIIANRAPIGFEAEFVNARGNNTLYRGILMPFSSDGGTIDHIYGVINWKELADPRTAMILAIEVGGAIEGAAPPRPAPAAPLWADGPGAQLPAPDPDPAGTGAATPPARNDPAAGAADRIADDVAALADQLLAARGTVGLLHSADVRTRSALYRALGLAYDFSCAVGRHPNAFAALLADHGIRAQARAPMTAITKLVFGTDYDKTRLTEYAAVLAHAHRHEVPSGGLRRLLERQEGGLKAVVAAERDARRAADGAVDPAAAARDALRRAKPAATIPAPAGEDEFVLLLARRTGASRLAVIAPVPGDAALVDRAIRRLAR